MARHLSKRDVKAVVDLIHGWTGRRLTWNAICEASESIVGKRPTRQSLSSHEEIASAYQIVRKALKVEAPKNPRPASLSIAAARITKLEREVEQLRDQNRLLKQMFVTWQYNAYKFGLTERQLNAPLPRIDRERSDNETR